MFEGLYEQSIRYDDNLLQAACIVMAEFDLETLIDIRILKHTPDFKVFLRATANEYKVSKAALVIRLKEILTDDAE